MACRRASAALAAATIAVSVGIAVSPRSADACSFIPESKVIRPAPGEEHPASAGMLMLLAGELGEIFSVMVDGVPASLVVREQLLLWGFDYYVVDIEPAPVPGQLVVVSQCGTEGQLEHGRCPPGSPFTPIIDFTVGPNDVAPPGAPGTVSLAHVIESVEDPCAGAWEIRFVVSLDGLDQMDEPDLFYRAELRDSSGEVVGVESRHLHEPNDALEIPITFESVPADAADHCIAVTVFDLSGNETLVGDICGSEGPIPEGATSSDDGGPGSSGGADVTGDDASSPVDGTTADPSSETSSGSDASATEGATAAELGDRGCVCATRRVETPPGLALLLLALAGPSSYFGRRVGARR